MCYPFIGQFAHVRGVFARMQFVPYVLPACQFMCWSVRKCNVVLSCRLLWWFLQRLSRGDNSNVETKPYSLLWGNYFRNHTCFLLLLSNR